jgi:RNA polymerase sigma-70 factor (ECF subfamily)
MHVTETQRRLLEHAPAIRKFVSVRIPQELRQVIDAEDVVNDVWARVLQANNSMGISEVSNIGGYLRRVASSVLVDKLRAFRTTKRGGGDDGDKVRHIRDARTSYINLFECVAGPRRTPSSEVAVREAVSAIQVALDRIPESQREAIRLYHLVGLTYAQIGRELEKSPRAVEGLLFRGINSLRTELGSAARYLSDAPSEQD